MKQQKTFKDIAGYEEEKEYLLEIADFLKNYQNYQDKGVKIPKGVLLYGEPGVGKTLFVKALVNETGTLMHEISKQDVFSKDIVETIKNIFAKAREVTPSIVFIDEIDRLAIDSNYSSSSDFNDRVLNQILIEMDGYNPLEGVIVIATANNMHNLGPALLRSGRFDRKMFFQKPDLQNRKKIISYYLENKKLGIQVTVDEIARMTQNMTGADIENLLNESFLYSIHKKEEKLKLEHLDVIINRMRNKAVAKKRVNNEETLEKVAYHESGHAIVTYFFAKLQVESASIIRHGNSGGRVIFDEKEDLIYDEDIISKKVAIFLAGKAAEDIIYKRANFGSSLDIKSAYRLVYHALMNEAVYGFKNTDIKNGSFDKTPQNKSSKIRKKADKIVKKGYKDAVKTIKKHKNKLITLKENLLINKHLTGQQIIALLDN